MTWSLSKAILRGLDFIRGNALACGIVLWACSLALFPASWLVEGVMVARLEAILANRGELEELAVRVAKLENAKRGFESGQVQGQTQRKNGVGKVFRAK